MPYVSDIQTFLSMELLNSATGYIVPCQIIDTCPSTLWHVWRIIPHYIHFPNQNCTPNCHSNRNNRQIHTRKIQSPYMDMLPRQNISPQKPGKRSTERRTKRAVIYSNSHAVHCCPECALADRLPTYSVDVNP